MKASSARATVLVTAQPRRRAVASYSRVALDVLTYLVLTVVGLVFLAPIGWMIITALKSISATEVFPPAVIPSPAEWSNFVKALTVVPFMHYIWNSTVYTGISIVGDVLSASFIAYGFARMNVRYRDALFIFVLATIMIPYQAVMIPQFILFRTLGWVNTYLPLIVPTFFGSPFLIFLMRQFYLGIPKEIDEAAKLDGAGHFRIWWSIIMPLSAPALASVAVFSFAYHWNDYLAPLIYINSTSKFTISLGLAEYTAAYGGTEWNYMMAATIAALIPAAVVFFVAQRYLVRGITIGSGVRG